MQLTCERPPFTCTEQVKRIEIVTKWYFCLVITYETHPVVAHAVNVKECPVSNRKRRVLTRLTARKLYVLRV